MEKLQKKFVSFTMVKLGCIGKKQLKICFFDRFNQLSHAQE